MLQEELEQVSSLISRIISEDSYPESIIPDYLRKAVLDYPSRGGKRLRPALVLWSCGLFDGDPEKAAFAATAVEIYHNWTLVHDDIIDNDDLRRGNPTIHSLISKNASGDSEYNATIPAEEFGRSMAILTGDIQQGWANNMLLKSIRSGVSSELTVSLAGRLQELVNRELISGEALDVEFACRTWSSLSNDQIEKMLYLKTGSLLRFSVETGAAIALDNSKPADFDDSRLVKIGQYAVNAGTAFQLRDDWLGIFGDPEMLGKPIFSDLSEAKPTLLLITALSGLDEGKKPELLKYIGRKEFNSQEIDFIRSLIRESGAEEIILRKACDLTEKAKELLNDFPDNKYRELLIRLTDYLIGRNK